jgi:hypothetical protein
MASEKMGVRETWIVRNWEPAMAEYFPSQGVKLDEIVDLDLEDGFVELLRAFRTSDAIEAKK